MFDFSVHKNNLYVIAIIYFPPVLNFTLSTDPFTVDPRPLTAGVYSMSADNIVTGENIALTLEIRDSTTDTAIPDITWRVGG